MRRNWMTILPLVFLISFINNSNAQEIKEITCTGKVINAESQPITDVRVSLYEYDSKLAAEVTTEADGTFSFSTSAESDSYRYGYIVAEKEGLALGLGSWDMEKDKALEIKLGQAKELTGIIVDENDKPVTQAEVGIYMLLIGEGEERRGLSAQVASKLLTVNTNSTGKFAFTNMPAEATAEFFVKKPGRAIVITYQHTGYASQKLQFAPGQTDIKLVVPVEAKIEGAVVEKNTGKPIGGIKVMAMQDWNRPLFGQELISSKEDGTFSINALVGGKHILQLVQSREGLADWVAEPVEVITEAGKTKSGVKVELSKGGLLEVVVTEAVSKQPLDKASVSISDAKYKRGLHAISDEDGVARIRLMPGGYQISGVYKQGFTRNRRQETITIGDGKTTHIDWQLASLPKITGVVRDGKDKLLEGVKLKVCPAGWQDVSSDADGKFEVSWDPGRWSSRETIFCLLARHKQSNLAAVEDIGEDMKRLDIKLKPGVIFAGKVVDPDGRGIADARIMIYLKGPGWGSPIGSSTIGRDQAKTDAQGKFEIKAVPMEHKYSIYASAKGYGDNRTVEVQTEDAVDNYLDVGTLTLPVANLSVSGKVVDTQGRPVAHTRIESSGFGEGQPSRLTTQTDKEGNFTLEGVCAGRVDIRANVYRDGKRLSARVFTDGGATGIKIVLHEGRSVVQQLGGKTYEQVIQSAGKVIAGIAVDENGSPVADVPVRVCCQKKKREEGGFVWMFGYTDHLGDTTDKEGHFAIELEEDGEYNLRFSPDKHAAIIAYDVPVGKKDLKVTLPDGGTITGHLVRMEKGKKVPIPNAEVKAEQTNRAGYTYLGLDRERTTVTNSQGRFRFEHLRTKIRPLDSKTAKQWKHIPRVWEISFGDTSKTIAFYDGTTIEDFELVVRPEPAKAPPLAGRPMPGFDGIKVDLAADQTKDKMMLVCFCDMEQRPSRNCLRQLSTRAKELKAKDVVVVAIQASKVDENTLNQWVKDYNIPSLVGMVQGDEEDIRFTWGVRSLPWLILTDRKHIVRAAGFGLSELNGKLEDTQRRREPRQRREREERELRREREGPADLGKVLEKPIEQESAAEGLGKPHRSLVVFPADSKTMELRWIAGKPDNASAVQNLELLIRRYCTYEVDTKDLASGQVAKKSLGWAVYPSVERGNQELFPLELLVETDQPVKPHSNYPAEVENVLGRRRLRWIANEQRVPSHFGYFGLTTQETVTGIEIRRECVPLGNGRARVKIIARAQMPLLVRIWGLKGRVNIEPESIEPQNYRLSDNGVLFFDYRKDLEGLGSESEYSFVISGLSEGHLFYPKTNALHHVKMRFQGCPINPMRQVTGSVWGIDFTLKSERCFRIARLKRWVNELYQLKALTVKPSPPVVGRKQRPESFALKEIGQVWDGEKEKFIDEFLKSYPDAKPVKFYPFCVYGKITDINKQPSWNCIRELAKRAEELKEKSVIVVAVHASKIDESTLSEWAKKYKIPFPVGIVQGDEQKARFTWGVRSLPWLILTDRKHIVNANGFSSTELDEKIRAAEK